MKKILVWRIYKMKEEWKKFAEGAWCNEVNVSDFIKNNYVPYDGNEKFLAPKTNKTAKVWGKCEELLKEELEKHVLDIDVDHMSGINAFNAGISRALLSRIGNENEYMMATILNMYIRGCSAKSSRAFYEGWLQMSNSQN